jgi:signal transduction histidine kinase
MEASEGDGKTAEVKLMNFRLRSLRAKLMIAFLLALPLPLLATAIYGHVLGRDVLAAQAVERSAQQVHLQAENIRNALLQVNGDALYLAEMHSLNALRQQVRAGQIAESRAIAARDVRALLSTRPMYHALRLLDQQGQEVIAVTAGDEAAQPSVTGRDRSSAAYFQIARALPPGEALISSFARDQAGEGMSIVYYALHLVDGRGVIVIDVHAEWLLRSLPAATEAQVWALVDQDGAYLVYPQAIDRAWFSDDLSLMLTGSPGSFETGQSLYVYEAIHPTAAIPDQFWVIYSKTSKSLLFENLQQFYLTASGLLLAGLGLAVLVAFIMSRIMVRSIVRLEHMAADFGRVGAVPELPARLPDDEIGSLTRTFGGMARELERKRRLEHRLIERLIHAQEEERKLVAYDLHDGLIQQMVGARLYLNQCREHHAAATPEALDAFNRGCDALTEAIVEGRRIIEGLRPAALDDLGLVTAIEESAQATARAVGWKLSLKLERLPTEPEKTVSVTLFRIMQEALNNARKHARAQQVSILLQNGHGIRLEISDDGSGFDPTLVTREGHGLGVTTMQERAALLGGECRIHSQPGQGTTVHVWVPSGVGKQ